MSNTVTAILELMFRFEAVNGRKPEFIYIGEDDFRELKAECENTLAIHDLQGNANPTALGLPVVEVKKKSFLRVG